MVFFKRSVISISVTCNHYKFVAICVSRSWQRQWTRPRASSTTRKRRWKSSRTSYQPMRWDALYVPCILNLYHLHLVTLIYKLNFWSPKLVEKCVVGSVLRDETGRRPENHSLKCNLGTNICNPYRQDTLEYQNVKVWLQLFESCIARPLVDSLFSR